MVAASALVHAGRMAVDEAAMWADACALLVEDGQEDAPHVLLARVDELTAERVRAALLGRMAETERAWAERVEDVYRTAVDVPEDELPEWAEAGIRVSDGRLAFSRHTLDLDAAEAEDGVCRGRRSR